MPKTMRESKMLEEVRRWRAEAYEAMRRESAATRLQHAREWARRLNLPILDEDDEACEDWEPVVADGLGNLPLSSSDNCMERD